MIRRRPAALPSMLLIAATLGCEPPSGARSELEWEPLFNGRDLDGWTPKLAGSELGVDPWRTFRVEDGLLTVAYDAYDDFGVRYGHLFYREPFSHYRLRVVYRFVGAQAPGGPEWAFENSGVMFHAQSPESMTRDQDFPISLEAQFLGGNGAAARPTGNLCTPGTHVEIDGALVERHCTSSSSRTYHGDEWVTAELVVLGDSLIVHLIDGDTVLSYRRPVVGGGVVSGHDPDAKADGTALRSGWIALQSESHPIQFREVSIQRLPPPVD